MTWPIPPLATTRTNDTPQFDTHPADHNAIADAINELGPRTRRVQYYATKAAADSAPASEKVVGAIAVVGTAAGGAGAEPRIYAWDTAWKFVNWWAPAGRPGVEVGDTAQSIPNSVSTAITWSTEGWDPDGWITGGGDALVVPAGWDGVYSISAYTVWPTTALGTTPFIALYINNQATYASNGQSAIGVYGVAATRFLAAGSTVRLYVFQNSAGNVAVSAANMRVDWIGR